MSDDDRPFLARYGRTLLLLAVAIAVAAVWLTRDEDGPRPTITYGDALRQEGHQ